MKRENKRKSSKSRLLLLILLLILTLSICTVGTYAWFTSNKVVDVTDLEVQVRAVNGLEISADAVNWGVRLNKADLIDGYASNVNQLPDILGAVSTTGTLTDGIMDMYVGAVVTSCPDGGDECDDPQYRLTTSQTAETECVDSGYDDNDGNISNCVGKYFMAFDIFLKVDQDSLLKLTGNSNVFNTSDVDKGIKNATRVALVVQGNIDYATYRDGNDSGQGYELAQALNGATGPYSDATGTGVVIWEPNYDSHTISGINAASKYYGITTANGGNALAYEGVKKNIDPASSDFIILEETNSTKWPAYFSTVTPQIYTATSHSGASSTITLKAGVTKVRVYFWVEGQDVDAENDATGSDMKLNMEFTID